VAAEHAESKKALTTGKVQETANAQRTQINEKLLKSGLPL
jgi:hypothetical protein